jgi:CCR4-NOT transcription complex subunit 7/8
MMLEVVGTMPSGETLRVREVWQSNLDAEMRIIESIVEDFPYLAMDTEFPGALARSLLSARR